MNGHTFGFFFFFSIRDNLRPIVISVVIVDVNGGIVDRSNEIFIDNRRISFYTQNSYDINRFFFCKPTPLSMSGTRIKITLSLLTIINNNKTDTIIWLAFQFNVT